MEQKKMGLVDYGIAVLFGATIVVVAAQVLFRYVFNSSLTWTEELSRYLFSWIIFLGAAIAVRDDTHISVDLLVNRLPRRVAVCVKFLTYILMLAFLLLVTVLGFVLVHRTVNTRSPALSLPVNWTYYAALPVTSLLGICYAVRKLAAFISGKENRTYKEIA